MLLLVAADCSEYGYTEVRQRDYFQQERLNAVDLLVVVDNSCSMVEEQDNLARNFKALVDTFAGADVSWQIAVTTTDVEADRYRGHLIHGEDEIILRGPGGEIDRVEYDTDWGLQPDTALSYPGDDESRLRFTWNDNPDNWCVDAGGTPGVRNPGCDAALPWTPPTGETDEGPRAPHAGDLVITEMMTMSEQEGPDFDPDGVPIYHNCEWFEVTSQTKDTLDLTQLTISDMGRNYIGPDGPVSFPDGAELEPYGVLLLARDAACGLDADFVFPEGFSLMDDDLLVTRDTRFKDELFSEMVAQGTTGTGIEMGMEAARLTFLGAPNTPALEDAGVLDTDIEYYNELNGAWLRDEASLAVLFVSDEDDMSPYPVDAYVRWFDNLKGDQGHRDESMVTLSAVVAKDPPPNPNVPSCSSPNGLAWYGLRYLEAANETGGLTESICEQDFAPLVERLGLTLSGLDLEFQLSEWPNIDTLEVSLYSSDSSDALERVLVDGVDFTYEPGCRRIVFSPEQVPPPEWYVVADYVPYPPGVIPAEADPECVE